MHQKRILLSAALSVCLLLALLALQIPLYTASSVAEEPTVQTEANAQRRITRFLVMGCDKSKKLTDSIFVVTLDEDRREASILQIPRDTYAEYTTRDYKKLNGAKSALGEKGVKDFLSRALGVPIQYFFVLDLDILRNVVDSIGGVDVEIPQQMIYSDPIQGLEINLQEGYAHLDGSMAEQFVRYRAGYPNADLGRLDAQKSFLRAFAKKCRGLTLSQLLPLTANLIVGVQTDVGLCEAIRVVSLLKECNADNIPMETLAGQALQGSSGAWYYAVNREGALRQVNQYLLPNTPVGLERFDPEGVLDREDFIKFHAIYTAPEGELPLE